MKEYGVTETVKSTNLNAALKMKSSATKLMNVLQRILCAAQLDMMNAMENAKKSMMSAAH